MRNILENLNEKQKEAVLQIDGPLLILAGAGSGKTSTMTTRIAYMVEQGIDPYNILAVTFTNKAAEEMRNRVVKIMGGATSIWIQTFHSTCLKILRMYGKKLGYDSSFGIYDPTDQKSVMKRILKETGISEKDFPIKQVLHLISKAKEKGVTPKRYTEKIGNGFRDEKVAILYEAYERELKKNNAMDFDDLILNAVRLVYLDEEVATKLQTRFKYIMVDEYQDTNELQYKLLQKLASPNNNICVVGDDDQCIYEWRGANINNILNFERDFKGAKVIKLEQNYRSTRHILDAAHSVISKNTQRKGKKLWTNLGDGQQVEYRRLGDNLEEADYIAKEIICLRNKGYDYSDIAILYRINSLSRNMESALGYHGIPCKVVGGVRYYERKEIKDLVSYLKLVDNCNDDVSLLRVINEPKRGIGTTTMEKIQSYAKFQGSSIYETLKNPDILNGLSKKARDGVLDFVDLIERYHKEKENLRIVDIYEGILKNSGYIKVLEEKGDDEARSRLDNLMEFMSVIKQYDEDETMNLSTFLEGITLVSDVDDTDFGDDTVKLMTIHSAKGLEFKVVFIIAMEDGIFPGERKKYNIQEMEEERRLCYVAMTRAKEILMLTRAENRQLYGQTEFTLESEFLKEIDPKNLTGDGIYKKANKVEEIQIQDFNGMVSVGNKRPFDSLDRARSRVLQKKKEVIELSSGDRVYHNKFKEGMVISANGNIAEIAFDDFGIKKMDITIAPLKKL